MEEEVIYNIKVNGTEQLDQAQKSTGKLGDELGKVSPALGSATNGLKGMITAAKAFIATPIGLVIAALGAAIGALTAYFKGSEQGQNDFNKIVKVGTVIMGNLLDIVRSAGSVLVKLFKGDLVGAGQAMADTFNKAKNIISETNAEIKKGLAIEDVRARTDVLERELIVLKAKNEAEIASLKLKAEDRSLSTGERQEALNRALQLQNELSEKQVEVAKNRLEIKREENSLSDSTKEDLMEEAQLQAALLNIEKERADKSKEIFTKEQALRKERLDQIELELGNERALRRQVLEETQEEEIELTTLHEETKISLATQFGEAILGAQKSLSNAMVGDVRKRNEYILKSEQAKNQQLAQLQNAAFALGAQLAGRNKALQSGLTLISTYFSAQKAFESQFVPIPDPSSPVRGAIAAGIAIASGLARVAQINNISAFAGGGLSGKRIGSNDGTPIRRSNGDNLLATVKTGEVILNERQQAMLGGDSTFRRMGVPGFAGGGFTSFAQSSEARNSQRDLFNSISQLKLFIAVEDINSAQSKVNIAESRALF